MGRFMLKVADRGGKWVTMCKKKLADVICERSLSITDACKWWKSKDFENVSFKSNGQKLKLATMCIMPIKNKVTISGTDSE